MNTMFGIELIGVAVPEDGPFAGVQRNRLINQIARVVHRNRVVTPAELAQRMPPDLGGTATGSTPQMPLTTRKMPSMHGTVNRFPVDIDPCPRKDGWRLRGFRRFLRAKSSPDILTTSQRSSEYSFRPSIQTAEKAAAAKISLEIYYNELLNNASPRDHRRHYFESMLYFRPQMPVQEKRIARRRFFYQESCYLRQCRVLKGQSQTRRRMKNDAPSSQNFEPVRVLGKGSFGVVRLVREKQTDSLARPQVFAMKVIRKSEMIMSGQEAHLRAERDFLVAAEGSNW